MQNRARFVSAVTQAQREEREQPEMRTRASKGPEPAQKLKKARRSKKQGREYVKQLEEFIEQASTFVETLPGDTKPEKLAGLIKRSRQREEAVQEMMDSAAREKFPDAQWEVGEVLSYCQGGTGRDTTHIKGTTGMTCVRALKSGVFHQMERRTRTNMVRS